MLTISNIDKYVDLKFEFEELQATELTAENVEEYISKMVDICFELEELEEE